MWKRAVLTAVILANTGIGARSQSMQEGDWVGQIIHLTGRYMDAVYKVRNTDDELQITLEVENFGPFEFNDIRVTPDSLFFVWEPSFELQCTLARLPDNVYHGVCKDPWGGFGGIVVAPPGSDADELTLDEMTFKSIAGIGDADSEEKASILGPMYPVGQSAQLSSGAVNYVDAGSGSVTVILIAGLGDNLTSWEMLHRRLARQTRVIAYDRPGLGFSEETSIPRTPEQMATELYALLRSANVTSPYLIVAHAESAFTARRFVDLYGENVHGLVLIDPHHEDQAVLWESLDAQGWQSYWAQVKTFQMMFPGGTGQEFETYAAIIDGERVPGLGPVPQVPTVVLTAGRVSESPRWIGETREGRAAWSDFHADWVREMPSGSRVIQLQSGPYIQNEKPDEVAEIIRVMLSTK